MNNFDNVYGFFNLKGGCGKTMLIYMLSACLSERGFKCLCVDTDGQHNLSKAFLNKSPVKGLSNVLDGECSVNDIIVQPYPNNEKLQNIYLLPCNYELFFFVEDGTPNKVLKLKKVMEQLNKEYDFIFVDTNPSISLITTSALLFCSNVIGVLDASLDSIEGFQFLEKKIISEIQKKANTNLKIFGIIQNNHDRRTNFTKTMMETTKKLYKNYIFKTIISPSSINKESRAARVPLIEYDPNHPSALQFSELTGEFLRRVGIKHG